jgi:hypothetical protein
VPADDPLDRRQADAVAREVLLLVQTLKGRNNRAAALVEPGPVVPHEIDPPSFTFGRAEFDAGLVGLRGEFPGVPEEIRERDPEQLRVGERGDAVHDGNGHPAVRLRLPELLHRGCGG